MLPCLIVHDGDGSVRRIQDSLVEFASTHGVDPRLRGRRFNDMSVVGQPALECSQVDEILASTSAGPTWVRRAGEGPNLHVSSIPLGDLDPGESIRDHCRFDRFSSLLPLTHLLDEVTRELAWTPPPLRASFIIDDPNLHWPTYGYVHFKELARHAEAHGYHIAMARFLSICGTSIGAQSAFSARTRQRFRSSFTGTTTCAPSSPGLDRSADVSASIPALRRVATSNAGPGSGRAGDRATSRDCSDPCSTHWPRWGSRDRMVTEARSEISGWEVAEFHPGGLPPCPGRFSRTGKTCPFRAFSISRSFSRAPHGPCATDLTCLTKPWLR